MDSMSVSHGSCARIQFVFVRYVLFRMCLFVLFCSYCSIQCNSWSLAYSFTISNSTALSDICFVYFSPILLFLVIRIYRDFFTVRLASPQPFSLLFVIIPFANFGVFLSGRAVGAQNNFFPQTMKKKTNRMLPGFSEMKTETKNQWKSYFILYG